jgi:hypothetical protein
MHLGKKKICCADPKERSVKTATIARLFRKRFFIFRGSINPSAWFSLKTKNPPAFSGRAMVAVLR